MSFLNSGFSVQEKSFEYSAASEKKPVYEVSLRVRNSSEGLQALSSSHRLVQTLLQGELLRQYELYDFLIWPEGLFLRVSLGAFIPLSEFLKFLKEKSAPLDGSFWDEELQWIKIIAPEKISESTRLFLETADRLRRDNSRTFGFSPSLFFFYRNPRLSR